MSRDTPNTGTNRPPPPPPPPRRTPSGDGMSAVGN